MSLRKQIADKTGVTPKLKIGKPGALDVIVDGHVVWSKEKERRMPTADEVIALLPRGA